MTLEEAKEKIFKTIINCQISTHTSLYAPNEAVITIGNLIDLIDGLTKYKARKALKILRDDGFICYKSQGCPAIVSYGEYAELVCDAAPPINGYAITKKVTKRKSGRRHTPTGVNQWKSGRTGVMKNDFGICNYPRRRGGGQMCCYGRK